MKLCWTQVWRLCRTISVTASQVVICIWEGAFNRQSSQTSNGGAGIQNGGGNANKQNYSY